MEALQLCFGVDTLPVGKMWRSVSQSALLGGWRGPWTSGLSVDFVQNCFRAAGSCRRADGCPRCLSLSLGLLPGFSNSQIQSPATENVPLHAGGCVYIMSCSLFSHQNKISLPAVVPHLLILLCTPKLIQIYPKRRKQQHCHREIQQRTF